VKSGVEDIKMIVMPFNWSVEAASNLIVIRGDFRKLLDFWASREMMERGFCEGYKQMVDRIDVHLPMTNIRGYHDPKQFLEQIFVEQKNWKSDLGYSKPEIALERDPLAIPVVIIGLMVCGLRLDLYSPIILASVLLLAVIAGYLLNRLTVVDCHELNELAKLKKSSKSKSKTKWFCKKFESFFNKNIFSDKKLYIL